MPFGKNIQVNDFATILNKKELAYSDILTLLQAKGEEQEMLFTASGKVASTHLGNKVFLRGLIEYSNLCRKDCLYCGIRKSNHNQNRYVLSDEDVLNCAQYAIEKNYGSIVIQAGERKSIAFAKHIKNVLIEIKKMSEGRLGITLSLGEQSLETYQQWFAAGAHRYLLRIETSNASLYKKIHPVNSNHNFQERLQALEDIKKAGFQLGTGVMIGLPFQTYKDLAQDLLFLKKLDVDMVGMGPYIEHVDTPLYGYRHLLLPKEERLNRTYKMIAILRLLMKDINIAATTALQAIDPMGREAAIKIGANILMPNITPGGVRKNYTLYENKPCIDEMPGDCTRCLDLRVRMAGSEIGYGQWGDSPHFINRKIEKEIEEIRLQN